MEYLYCGNDNFEDFASGRVLYSGKGIPNFPVRLLNEIYGSDIDESMIAHARKNTGLLTASGLNSRRREIERLHKEYGKHSHMEALNSCDKLEGLLKHGICVDIFKADCTEALPRILPDIIITDVPYGNLVEWKNGRQISVDSLLEQLWLISHEKTVLAVCMDKKQKSHCEKWERLEKHNIGKRRFEILRRQ